MIRSFRFWFCYNLVTSSGFGLISCPCESIFTLSFSAPGFIAADTVAAGKWHKVHTFMLPNTIWFRFAVVSLFTPLQFSLMPFPFRFLFDFVSTSTFIGLRVHAILFSPWASDSVAARKWIKRKQSSCLRAIAFLFLVVSPAIRLRANAFGWFHVNAS